MVKVHSYDPRTSYFVVKVMGPWLPTFSGHGQLIEKISQKCKCFLKLLEIFLENQYPSQINGFQCFLRSKNVLTKFSELTYFQYLYTKIPSINDENPSMDLPATERGKKETLNIILYFNMDVRNISVNSFFFKYLKYS